MGEVEGREKKEGEVVAREKIQLPELEAGVVGRIDTIRRQRMREVSGYSEGKMKMKNSSCSGEYVVCSSLF